MICSNRNHDQHERYLEEQLDWLTVDHDDLKNAILEQIATPKYHLSMKVIDEWETEAIARIRSTAFFARRTLIDGLDRHALQTKKLLNMLTPILDQARQDTKSFDENDIRKWANILHDLKQSPIFPVTIDTDNNIHGLIINLERQQRTLSYPESMRYGLVTIIHDSIPSTYMSNESEYQSIYDTKRTDEGNRKVRFNDTSLIETRIVKSKRLINILEQQKNQDVTSHIPSPTIRKTPR